MLQDARQWLNSGRIEDPRQARSGATALHVAAAKGYSEVLRCVPPGGRRGRWGHRDRGCGGRSPRDVGRRCPVRRQSFLAPVTFVRTRAPRPRRGGRASGACLGVSASPLQPPPLVACGAAWTCACVCPLDTAGFPGLVGLAAGTWRVGRPP